jgi:hypothetical protein
VAQRDNGDAACFHRRALITCSSSGATRLVGAVQTLAPDIADEAAIGWSLIEADDEHDALRVRDRSGRSTHSLGGQPLGDGRVVPGR